MIYTHFRLSLFLSADDGTVKCYSNRLTRSVSCSVLTLPSYVHQMLWHPTLQTRRDLRLDNCVHLRHDQIPHPTTHNSPNGQTASIAKGSMRSAHHNSSRSSLWGTQSPLTLIITVLVSRKLPMLP